MNRRAVEWHLRPGELELIETWCRLESIPFETWPHERRLLPFIDVAVARYLALLAPADARFGLEQAARHFGLNLEALDRRRRRRPSRRATVPPAGETVPIDLTAERRASRQRLADKLSA